jgi:hypothetical protein
MQLAYAGTKLNWSISDQVLTLTPVGGSGHPATVDLTAYSLATLATLLGGMTGITVTGLDATRSGLSAVVLLDGVGDTSQAGGNKLIGYTSILWAYMEAVASELQAASKNIALMPAMMNLNTSQGMWLDELGGYYNVPRAAGELDPVYGPRIIAETLRPKGNNVALEMAIQAYTGQVATVTDVSAPGPYYPLYNGSITYNGAHTYSSGPSALYGLFDVAYAYDLINGGDITSFQTAVRGLIERLRDAGTHLRALALTQSVLSDTLTAPTDSSILALGVSLADTLTAPTDISVLALAIAPLFDALTAPNDNTDALALVGNYLYDGSRNADGTWLYASGRTVNESMDGGTIYSVV